MYAIRSYYEESRGLLAAAEGGTLFLDEVGELPAAAQSRLLRALDSNPDVRLIAASHRDLQGLVGTGQFRKDLYYRLKVVALHVPPLRDRGDDVLLLAEEMLDRTMQKLGKKGLYFADAALRITSYNVCYTKLLRRLPEGRYRRQ